MTYGEVYNLIKAALTGRLAGTKIQAEDHEAAEIAILDYVEDLKSASTGNIIREAHAACTGGLNCNLVWSTAFVDTDYSFQVSGHDGLGNPVEIYFISKSTTKIVVKTLVNATLFAFAMPYGGITG